MRSLSKTALRRITRFAAVIGAIASFSCAAVGAERTAAQEGWISGAHDAPSTKDWQQHANTMQMCAAEGAHAGAVWRNLNERRATGDEQIRLSPNSLKSVTRRAVRDWRSVAAESIYVRDPVFEAAQITAACMDAMTQ